MDHVVNRGSRRRRTQAVFALALCLAGGRSTASAPNTLAQEPATAVALRVPIEFVENRGQTDARVRFMARVPGGTLFLTHDEAVFVAAGGRRPDPRDAHVAQADAQGPRPVVRLRFTGAADRARVEGLERLEGVSHFYIGNDRSKWRTHVPHFARVAYRQVWPGIDAVFYARDGALEYDFVVAPGADPRRIDLRFEGADDVRVDQTTGELVVRAGRMELRQPAPETYQGAPAGRAVVPARYALRDGRVGFTLGAYDVQRELVIDPKVKFSTYLGGTGSDIPRGVAVTPGNQPIVVGETDSPDFPGTTTAPDETAVFVTKLNSAGSAIVHTVLLDGNGDDVAYDVTTDSSGLSYVVGEASFFFPTLNGYDETHGTLNSADAFAAKLDLGGQLVFSTFLGGADYDGAFGVALDASRRVYVVGETDSAGGFPTKNRSQGCGTGFPVSLDSTDAFLTVLVPAGNDLVYSTCLGGIAYDSAVDVAVDAAGNAYVTGETTSNSTFPTKSPSSLPPFQESYGGGPTDAFISKFDPFSSGNASLVYSTFLGGSGTDKGFGVAVEPATQRAYVTGLTGSTNFPRLGGFDSTNVINEAFVTKLNADGTTLFYSTFLGGNNEDVGNGIAVDALGNAYVAGGTRSTDFGALRQFDAAPLGARDAFVVKIAPDGARKLYSIVWGGAADENALNIVIDANGGAYAVGGTSSSNYPVSAGVVQSASRGGGFDGFLVKVAPQNPETIGVWQPGDARFLLRNTNNTDTGRQNFQFGLPTDIPICGDWDGDADKTCGIYRDGNFQLLNVHTGLGQPSFVFNLAGAGPGDQPISGDWDGDGRDGVGVLTVAGQFLLDNNLDGVVDVAPFAFGLATDLAIAGDWDGDGDDTIGIFRDGSFQLLLNNVTALAPDILATFGAAGDLPVVGDWDGDGVTTIGVFVDLALRGHVFRLRNSNTTGSADLSVTFGSGGDFPLAGDWNGRP